MERPFTLLSAVALRLAAALLPLGLWVTAAAACELCLQAANERLNLVDQLVYAKQVVLAKPDGASGQLRITATIKGVDQTGTLVAESVPLFGKPSRKSLAALLARNGSELLVADGIHPGWTNLGTVGEENADWLKMLAATAVNAGIDPVIGRGAHRSEEAVWRERVLLALPHLGGRLRTIEWDLAWSEIVRAPYGSLDAVKGRLPPDQVAQWLDDPAFAKHIGGILHLYGYVGGTEGAKRVRERLLRAAEARDTAALAPLLAAHLELDGPSRVDWIETTYLVDRSRSIAEIQAALLALRLQGQADATIPRSRVIASLRRFIAERPAMAGSVALTLADWGSWEAKVDYEAVLASGAITDPASEFAVALYLKRAEAALQANGR